MMWLRVRRFVACVCLGAAGMLALEGDEPCAAFVPGHHARQFLIGEDGDPSLRPLGPVLVVKSVNDSPPLPTPRPSVASLSLDPQLARGGRAGSRYSARASPWTPPAFPRADSLSSVGLVRGGRSGCIEPRACGPGPGDPSSVGLARREAADNAEPRAASHWRPALMEDAVVGAAPAPPVDPVLYQGVLDKLFPDPPSLAALPAGHAPGCLRR